MNKRWLALTLAWALALGLCACGNETESPAPGQEPTEAALELRDITPEEWEAELYACTVPGEEADYEEIARQLTEQYAQALRARPQNLRQSVLDAQPMPQEELVYDAYYGEEAPNFCFILSLSLDLAEERAMDWMVGSDLEEPSGEGPYPTYWGWSREAMAEKGEDGDWHLAEINTGGTYTRLPVAFEHPDDHPSVEDMLDIWFLTEGDTRDWRIFTALDTGGYTADEVKAAMDKYPEEKQNVLLDGVRDYMIEHVGGYTWTLEDWM